MSGRRASLRPLARAGVCMERSLPFRYSKIVGQSVFSVFCIVILAIRCCQKNMKFIRDDVLLAVICA